MFATECEKKMVNLLRRWTGISYVWLTVITSSVEFVYFARIQFISTCPDMFCFAFTIYGLVGFFIQMIVWFAYQNHYKKHCRKMGIKPQFYVINPYLESKNPTKFLWFFFLLSLWKKNLEFFTFKCGRTFDAKIVIDYYIAVRIDRRQTHLTNSNRTLNLLYFNLIAM